MLATVRDLSMRKTLTSLLHCLPRQIPAKWHSPTTAHLSSHRGPRAVGKLCPAGDLCPTAPVNRGNDNRVHVQPAIPECSFMVRSHLTATILVYTAIFSSQAAEVGWGSQLGWVRVLSSNPASSTFPLSYVSLVSLPSAGQTASLG